MIFYNLFKINSKVGRSKILNAVQIFFGITCTSVMVCIVKGVMGYYQVVMIHLANELMVTLYQVHHNLYVILCYHKYCTKIKDM